MKKAFANFYRKFILMVTNTGSVKNNVILDQIEHNETHGNVKTYPSLTYFLNITNKFTFYPDRSVQCVSTDVQYFNERKNIKIIKVTHHLINIQALRSEA